MQIMHRAHFPELCASEKDIEFGLAVYVPTEHLTDDQVFKLESILIESQKNLINPEGQYLTMYLT